MGIFSDVLLTVDYDRTLTAPDSTIPARNLEAIRYFIDNGGSFTVNTGRSVPMTKVFRDVVPVNAPLLLYNGSAAYNVKENALVFYHPIPLDMWDTVAKCRELLPDLMVEVQGIDAHYRFNDHPLWDAFCDNQPCAHAFAEPGMNLEPFLKISVYGEIREVTVSHLFEGTTEEIRRMDEAELMLNQLLGAHCSVFRSGARIIDIHVKGVSKARSAKHLQQLMNKKILVCVGDGHNDTPMLQDADYAYVPEDAVIADQFETVCKCADGAVADVIYKKIPEILGIKA